MNFTFNKKQGEFISQRLQQVHKDQTKNLFFLNIQNNFLNFW